MKTENKGIDYSGPGATCNRNVKTGIRYGIIPQHDVMAEALDDIFTHGKDLDFEAYIKGAKDEIRRTLADYFSDYKRTSGNSPLDCSVENAFDAISDNLGDNYQSDGAARMEYEIDGYKLMTDGSGDLWVLESKFFTYARFCSPCAPGACHLDCPLDNTPIPGHKGQPPNDESLANNRAYCLGADWFENEKAPYPIYSVATGKLISTTP